MVRYAAVEVQPADRASKTSAASNRLSPDPPYSSPHKRRQNQAGQAPAKRPSEISFSSHFMASVPFPPSQNPAPYLNGLLFSCKHTPSLCNFIHLFKPISQSPARQRAGQGTGTKRLPPPDRRAMNTREAEIAMTNRKFPETRMRRLRAPTGRATGARNRAQCRRPHLAVIRYRR